MFLEYAVLLLASIDNAAGHQVHWLKHFNGRKDLLTIFFVAILEFQLSHFFLFLLGGSCPLCVLGRHNHKAVSLLLNPTDHLGGTFVLLININI
jgi:hypothetical protein